MHSLHCKLTSKPRVVYCAKQPGFSWKAETVVPQHLQLCLCLSQLVMHARDTLLTATCCYHEETQMQRCSCLLPLTLVLQGDNAALHWAAMRGHVEVVRALLAGGADKEARNKQGAVPVELCQPVWSLSWRFTQAVLAAS
jgi:hypothetical protein